MKLVLVVCILFLVKAIRSSVLSSISKELGLNEIDNCIFDAECRTAHFCKTELLNPVGKCVEGKGENELCIKNSVCASDNCSFFKCTKRIVLKDGPCKKSVRKIFSIKESKI